jgi:rubredoxin
VSLKSCSRVVLLCRHILITFCLAGYCSIANGCCGGRLMATIALRPTGKTMSDYKSYMCVICGFIYHEAEGLPEEGIAPHTRWEDIPLNWVCPECGAGKEDFEMVEV